MSKRIIAAPVVPCIDLGWKLYRRLLCLSRPLGAHDLEAELKQQYRFGYRSTRRHHGDDYRCGDAFMAAKMNDRINNEA
jgi:hypothetical protein